MSEPIFFLHPDTIALYASRGVKLPDGVVSLPKLGDPAPHVTSEKVAEVLKKLWGHT